MQLIGRTQDRPGPRAHAIRRCLVACEQLRVAADGRQWRPQLVRDVRQELVAQLVPLSELRDHGPFAAERQLQLALRAVELGRELADALPRIAQLILRGGGVGPGDLV